MFSPGLKAFLRQRIADAAAPERGDNWPEALARENHVFIVAGEVGGCWYLGVDGQVFFADRDKAQPRLEPVDAFLARRILEGARVDFPELGELLAVPHLDPAGGREILSPDGLWRARAEADLDAEGGDVTVVTVNDAGTGDRVAWLELRWNDLRLVRFLAPRRLLLAEAESDVFFELDFDAPRPKRMVLPALVVDAYAPGAPEAPQAPQEPVPKTSSFVGELNAELSFLSMFIFFWLAGLLPILPGVKAISAGSEERMQAVGWLLGALIGSILLFQAGLRERVVALNEGGEVVVRWGRRAPLILARLPARGLQEVSIDREVRLSMSGRGGGRYGVRRRDDRFRVKARGLLGRVDLGSYATEALAEAAVKHTRSWA